MLLSQGWRKGEGVGGVGGGVQAAGMWEEQEWGEGKEEQRILYYSPHLVESISCGDWWSLTEDHHTIKSSIAVMFKGNTVLFRLCFYYHYKNTFILIISENSKQADSKWTYEAQVTDRDWGFSVSHRFTPLEHQVRSRNNGGFGPRCKPWQDQYLPNI